MNAARVWLLPLVALSGCGGSGEMATTDTSPTYFSDAPVINFVHDNGATGRFGMHEILGAGAALLDFDSDGDLDMLAIQSVGQVAGDPVRHRLFDNRLVPDGVLGFVDVSEKAGIETSSYGMGTAVGDFDNDGDPDIYVTAFGANALFRNDGDRFTDVTVTAGVDEPRWSTSALFVDVNRDGLLDLYVANYLYFSEKAKKRCNDAAGREDYCTPDAYKPVPDTLFVNSGDGRFRKASAQWGIDLAFGPGLGVVAADFNLDGYMDVYVANDGQANQLWMNDNGTRFIEQAAASGAAYNMSGLAEGSMGVSAGDYDGDGDEDLFMTHLSSETNTIYRNEGEAGFFDVTDQVHLGSASLSFTGFGTGWFDPDNDGDLDLIVANGAVQRGSRAAVETHDAYGQRNQLFSNEGAKFTERSELLGAEYGRSEVGRGVAFGDVNNDGCIDTLVTNNNGPLRLLLNRCDTDNAWIRVRLTGKDSNRDAVGARVALIHDDGAMTWRRVHTDGSYLSASDSRVHFGLGQRSESVAIGVVWPGGRAERWSGLAPGRQHELHEGSGKPWSRE